MPARKGLLAPQNTFLDTIATRFDGTHSNFVLGNAKIAKVFPIVYCSDGFCELTGYSRAQIMQKSCACNFLYGQKTDVHHKAAISAALESKQELKLEVVLYRSSGTPFWCLLDIVPIQDEKHEVVLFLCSHKDITKQKLHEQQQKIAAHQQQLALAAAAQQEANHLLAVSEHQQQQHGEQQSAAVGELTDQQHQQGNQQLMKEDKQRLQQQQMDDQQALLSMEEFKLDEMEALNEGMSAGDDLDGHLMDADDDDEHHNDKHTASQYSRRRSRAVLYQLSGHYGYRRSVNMKSKLKLNNRMTIPEYKTTTIEKQTFILSHYGVGKSCWDWLILIVSFYVAIVVPYNATFKEKHRTLAYDVLDMDAMSAEGGGGGASSSSSLSSSSSYSSEPPPGAVPAPYLSTGQYSSALASSSSSFPSSPAANEFASNYLRPVVETSANSSGGGSSSNNNSSDPADADFNYSTGKECEIDSIDIFVEVVFLIDVILNFRTTFVNRKGEVVTRPKIICKHYVRGWFIVDACAALPFDLLCGFNLYSRSRLKVDLNLLKLIRLLRLARLLQKMDRYSQYSYIILTLLMLIFSLLAHWCACIWYVIAMEEIERHPPEWKLGWIHQLSDKLGYNVVNATDMASSYVTALYFTTSSLTSVGFGNVSANTNAEKIFSIVIMLIGALMHAVVFGNVTALIRVMYARRSNYQTRLRDLKDFFRLHQLPKDLQQRMSDYFQTTWSLNHGIDTSEILKDFPEELRGDVSLHLHREVLSLPIFGSAPQGFLKSLARHIESKFCCPTEYLIHRGDALNYLYLVCNGSMEVLQDNMVVGILGKGDLVGYDVNAVLSPHADHGQFVGASSAGQLGGPGGGLGSCGGGLGLAGGSSGGGGGGLAMGKSMGSSAAAQNAHQLVKSSSDLKALTYCDLKCIHIGGLLEVLKLYPEFSDTFHDEIMHDLSFNLREQHEEIGQDDDDEDEDEEEDDDDMDEDEEDEDEHGQEDDEGDNEDDDDDDNNNDDDDGDDDQDEHGHPYDDQQAPLFEPPDGGQSNKPNGNTSSAGGAPNGRRSPPPPPPPPSGGQQRSQPGSKYRPGGGDNPPNGGEHQISRYDDDQINGQQSEVDDEELRASFDTDLLEEDDEEAANEDGQPSKRVLDNTEDAYGDSGECLDEKNKDNNAWQGLEQQQQNQDEATSLINEPIGRLRMGIYNRPPTGRHHQMIGGSGHDWRHFSLSCDDQLHRNAGPKRGRQEPTNDQQQQTSTPAGTNPRRLVAKNKSNETILPSNDSPKSIINSRPLRSAIGISSMSGGGGPRSKPPLSFDLSRNTTAIVDRRRRSAGCIQRPNLINVSASSNGNYPAASQPQASNRNRCHSSLIHISENEPMRQTKSKNCQRNKLLNNSQFASNQKSSSGDLTDNSTTTTNRVKSSYSNQDFKQIDAHITASVRKLRQEFRQELNHAVKLLTKLVLERETANNNNSHSSIGPSMGKPRRLKSHLSGSLNNNNRMNSGDLSLIQSTGSLTNSQCPPSVATTTSAVAANRLRHGTVIPDGLADGRGPSSDTTPISRSISSVSIPMRGASNGQHDESDCQEQSHSTTAIGLQHSVVSVVGNDKPSSFSNQTHTTTATKVLQSSGTQQQEPFQQVSVEQTSKMISQQLMMMMLGSDNDSGRSTSSLNSSGNRTLNSTGLVSQSPASVGGRLAQVRLTKEREECNEQAGGGEDGKRPIQVAGHSSYTIDIKDNNCEHTH